MKRAMYNTDELKDISEELSNNVDALYELAFSFMESKNLCNRVTDCGADLEKVIFQIDALVLDIGRHNEAYDSR
jgi:hypothetical protein